MDWDLLLERFYEQLQDLAIFSDYYCTKKVNDNNAVIPKYRKCYSTEEINFIKGHLDDLLSLNKTTVSNSEYQSGIIYVTKSKQTHSVSV
jgi:hypothetical protein